MTCRAILRYQYFAGGDIVEYHCTREPGHPESHYSAFSALSWYESSTTVFA